MAAFTKIDVILTSSSEQLRGRPWIHQGHSTDITTAQEALAGEANVQHYIQHMHIHYDPGATGKWYQLQDDNHNPKGPRMNESTYAPGDDCHYIRPLPMGVGRGIYFIAEAAGDFGYTLEGFSRTERGLRSDEVIYATSSLSASVSASTSVSTSISASPSAGTPSASLSVSASPSEGTPSTSVSSSPSTSVSSSASGTPSSSPSASISASPSWSG